MPQSADIRADLATQEAALPVLHDNVSRTALASYAEPENPDLRREAGQALAALRDATDRLEQLRAALPLAITAEAAEQEAVAEAGRQAEKDKLAADLDRVGDRYLKLSEKIEADQAVLDQALLDLDTLETELQHAQVKAEVYAERVGNDTRRLDALADEYLGLEDRIAAFPVTAAEVAAAETKARSDAASAAETEAATNLRLFEADTARQLAELVGNQLVDAPAPFEPETGTYGNRPDRWQRAPEGRTIRLKRKALLAHEARMAEAAAWVAEHVEPYEIVQAADRKYYLGPDNHVTISLGAVSIQRHLVPEFLAEQKRLKAKAEQANPRTLSPSQWAVGAVGIVLDPAMPARSLAEEAALWRRRQSAAERTP